MGGMKVFVFVHEEFGVEIAKVVVLEKIVVSFF